jgi:hypothetical protein
MIETPEMSVTNLPNDMVSYHRTLESSLMLLCEPHILQNAITIFITQYDFSQHSILFATLSGHAAIHVCHRNHDKPKENGRNIHEASIFVGFQWQQNQHAAL